MFCPYDDDHCPGCKEMDAECRLNRILAGLSVEDYDPWDDDDTSEDDCL